MRTETVERSATPAGDGTDVGVGREREIYERRFSAREDAVREATWQVFCARFLQPRIDVGSTVVDLGAGDGLFLRNIRAKRRIAVDINPDTRGLEQAGIETVIAEARSFADAVASADVVFASNLLEHLADKREVLDVLGQCREALRPGGRLILLQPNLRKVGAAYWDYIDHQVPLTDRSLAEGLRIQGFEIQELIPALLPYTVTGGLGRLLPASWTPALVRLYLALPILWPVLGAQTFVVARRPVAEGRP